MAQSEWNNAPQDNEGMDQITLVKVLQEKLEEQMMMIQELRITLQQREREKGEREMD